MTAHIPQVGAWYRSTHYPHNLFEVIAIDDHDGTVTMEFIDGELNAVELEQWPELSAQWVDEGDWARVIHFSEAIEPADLKETDWDDIDAQPNPHFFISPEQRIPPSTLH